MEFKEYIGFGVAGNFAGHLEQAGEASDFKGVKTTEAEQPKAIFPFYVPATTAGFLSTYPLSHHQIQYPHNGNNLQIEPEIALICQIEYTTHHQVSQLIPLEFAAYNDCSIRRPNANKICEKKNWGVNSKGLANHRIALSSFEAGSEIDHYRIACFHKHQGKTHIYGVDSPAIGYSYFHHKLLDWVVYQMNHQQDLGPMNAIAPLLKQALYPTKMILSIGATRYTEYGEKHFLQPHDTSIVVVYPKHYSADDILAMTKIETFASDISALVQRVI